MRQSFYFDNFVECANLSYEAAQMLENFIIEFNPNSIEEKMHQLHYIENNADHKKHEMIYELVRAFITPIERDDIIKLSQNIDDVTDSVEDIIIHMYINNITVIRDDCVEFASLLTCCCSAMKDLLDEFCNFKKSKLIHERIIEINRLEEEGDKMYITAMKNLHTYSDNPLEIIAWRKIYECFEKCFDTVEHVADIVESIIIGNT